MSDKLVSEKIRKNVQTGRPERYIIYVPELKEIQAIEKQVEELKEGYECALSHIKTLNDGVLMSQNIWDKVIAQADDLLNDKA